MALRVEVKGELFEVKGFTKEDMEAIKNRVRVRVEKAQEALVATEGTSAGTPWAGQTAITRHWKERFNYGPELLHGRTGRLLDRVAHPSIVGWVNPGAQGFILDVWIAPNLKTQDWGTPHPYAMLVQEGWHQNVTGPQSAWMRDNLQATYRVGEPFSTPGRNLIGFDEEDIFKWTKSALRREMLSKFVKRIPIVGRFF